jgi:hypothetical protein
MLPGRKWLRRILGAGRGSYHPARRHSAFLGKRISEEIQVKPADLLSVGFERVAAASMVAGQWDNVTASEST